MMSFEQVLAIPPEAWPKLVFKPHPTAIRLTFRTNAADIWSALKSETAPPEPKHLPEPQAIVVWRQEFLSRFRPLSSRHRSTPS